MLIGQIEQEILEGHFWFLGFHNYPNSEALIDLQKHEEEDVWQLQQSKLQRFDGSSDDVANDCSEPNQYCAKANSNGR